MRLLDEMNERGESRGILEYELMALSGESVYLVLLFIVVNQSKSKSK